MSTKRTIYRTEFKTKLVLEALKNEQTITEIASKYNITPKTIRN
jgi:putative transposase